MNTATAAASLRTAPLRQKLPDLYDLGTALAELAAA
jgi:hypothetical protein